MDAAAALAAYDRQVRRSLTPPQPGWLVERAGRVVRCTSPAAAGWGCFVIWSDLGADTADAVIAEQVGYFGGLGRAFEWKTYGYDRPADLGDRLRAAGFVAGDEEQLLVGATGEVLTAVGPADPPAGVSVREPDVAADFVAIDALHAAVWGGDHRPVGASLAAEQRADPAAIRIYLAEAADRVVCAAWVRFEAGTEFASLWGGSTLPGWRRRGVYRSLVARRARDARVRGYPWLQVDASPDSRPILERLGMQALTSTTPYDWRPPGTGSAG